MSSVVSDRGVIGTLLGAKTSYVFQRIDEWEAP
jgi:hypothetical protein